MNCPNCGVPLMGGMVICPKCKYDTRTKDGGESFRKFRLQKEEEKNREEQRKAEEEAAAIKAGNRDALRRAIVLTTCPSVEGYRVTRQCGLVFGEVVFKTNFFKSLGASIENKFDTLVSNVTFSDKELAGTTRLITNAREYAMTKMKDQAMDRNANAIIGVQVESSVGGEFLHITISGTAVEVEKVNE